MPGPRAVDRCRTSSPLGCRNCQRKAIGMVEVRFAGRMRESPIGFATARFLDHRRESELPNGATWQVRQPLKIERDLQFITRRIGSHRDARRADLACSAHCGAIAVESIGSPLRRRRKVEFEIRSVRRGAEECLEAGAPPKFIGARWGSDRRQAQSADFARHDIAKLKQARARTRRVRFDFDGGVATRVRMTVQNLAHPESLERFRIKLNRPSPERSEWGGLGWGQMQESSARGRARPPPFPSPRSAVASRGRGLLASIQSESAPAFRAARQDRAAHRLIHLPYRVSRV